MSTVNKILKQHAEVFDPHKQIIENIKINSKLYIPFILILIVAIAYIYSVYKGNVLFIVVSLFFFLLTVAASSYWHFKRIDNLYGLNKLDIDRIKRFTELVSQKTNINLYVEAENILVEALIRERLEKVHRLEQSKKTVSLALITTALPALITLVTKNNTNVQLLTLTIMGIGFIFLFISFKSAFKEYTKIPKLEHISEILKEIRLSQLVTNQMESLISSKVRNQKIMHINITL
jgi:hypothetical protein